MRKALSKFINLRYRIFGIRNPELHLMFWYRIIIGRRLNFENPKSLSEKIQWLKLYDPMNYQKTDLADKYKVRSYIAKKIGEAYLIPLIGVYDNFDEIDFSKLPEEYVIKTNHDSGHNVIVDKSHPLDKKWARRNFSKWLKQNYSHRVGYEMQYRDIKPKILIEKKIGDPKHESLIDYKFLCFNGRPDIVAVYFDRSSNISACIYDMEWNKLPVATTYSLSDARIDKPRNFDEMVRITKILSEDFSFVRVDLYNIDGKIYFGEMTFTPGSMGQKFHPISFDYELGKRLVIPQRHVNIWKRYTSQKGLTKND